VVLIVVGLLVLGLAFTYRFEGGGAVGSSPIRSSTGKVTSTTSKATLISNGTTSQSNSRSSTQNSVTSTTGTSVNTSTISHTSTRTSTQSTQTIGSGATASCFTGLKYNSSSTLSVDGINVNVVWYLNPEGTAVVVYGFPTLPANLTSGHSVSYAFSFAPNSTFTGVLFNANLTGAEPIQGFAGLSGSLSYFGPGPKGPPNQVVIVYLVPEGSTATYVVGVTNSYSGTQTASIDFVLAGTCGESWLSGISVG
jgi:hypothetical protein